MSTPSLTDPTPVDRTPVVDPATSRRLTAVTSLGVLDRIGDPTLVSLTRLAQAITGAAGAAIHIFDATHQRRVAAAGVPMVDHPAEDSMCRLVVESGDRIVCSDACNDPRFSYSSFTRTDTEPVVRFYVSVPLKVSAEVTVGTLCVFDSISHELDDDQLRQLDELAGLAQAHLTLMQLATDLGREASVDGLTGASTRVLFDDRVARALAARRSEGGDVLVITADLDDFKSINDTYGHDRGDGALCLVAGRLAELAGPDAVVGRLGGDEFGVMINPAGTWVPALLDEIGRIGASFAPPFRVSVGVACAEADDDVPSLMRRADARMYADKASGRRLPYRAATV